MFVGNSQNFPGSWGSNFVGTCSKFGIILINIKEILVYIRSCGCNLWASVTNKIHKHWSPTNNDDSTACEIKFAILVCANCWE